jgi:hypothetical protein
VILPEKMWLGAFLNNLSGDLVWCTAPADPSLAKDCSKYRALADKDSIEKERPRVTPMKRYNFPELWNWSELLTMVLHHGRALS